MGKDIANAHEDVRHALEDGMDAIADLNQTIAGPSIPEVQAISDKLDALLAALRSLGILAS